MIRLMNPADRPHLAKLFLQVRVDTFHWVKPTCFRRDDFISQTHDETIWVAEQEETLCGFIAIWQPEAFVHHLYVSTDWHGQGIGRTLLKQGLANARCQPSLKVTLRNTAAQAFYHRLGWRRTQETGHCEITGPWCRLIAPWPHRP